MLVLALDPNAQVVSSTAVNPGVIEIPASQPAGFDNALWQLLQEIKTAGIPLRGKIAEYAGFYHKLGTAITTEWDPTSNNGVNPDVAQTGTSQPNRSLDKLTFLIMFRLPFRGETVEVTPPLTDPEADLSNNRKIVKKTDGSYVLGAFHEVFNDKNEITSVPFQLCTITRPNPIASFEIGGKDLFYDTPTDSFYVYGPYVANFGDPLASTATTWIGNPTVSAGMTWSKKGNDLRAAAGLKRLNGAGEQVNLVGTVYQHVDNAGNAVGFDYNTPDTANAYAYYEIAFADLYPGKSPPEHVDDQATIAAIKTLPLYYFLTVYTENKPQNFQRQAHFPDQLKASERAKRPITFGTYAGTVFSASSPQPADSGLTGQHITRDAANHYYVTAGGTGAVYYLTEDFPGDEDFTADSFYLNGTLLTGLIVAGSSAKYYAQHPTRLSRATTKWASGLTFGYGYDIGGNYATANVYKVEFTIQLRTGAGSVVLHYASDSATIQVATDAPGLRRSLSQLMGIDLNLITVSTGTVVTTGYSAWDVSIQQRIGNPVNGSYNVYSHELFYHTPPAENPPKVLITLTTDSQRYVPRSAAELPSAPNNYASFETLLNGFYASNDFTAPNPAQDGTHKDGFDPNAFKAALKKIFGLYRGPGMLIYLNNRAVFDAFQMPVAKQTIVKNYALIFSQKYYTSAIEASNIGGIVAVGAKPNVLEKLLLATVSYGGIGKWRASGYQMSPTTLKPVLDSNGKFARTTRTPDPSIVLAISSHNQYELKRIFNDKNPTLPARRAFLVGYVDKFQHILYRGVEA